MFPKLNESSFLDSFCVHCTEYLLFGFHVKHYKDHQHREELARTPNNDWRNACNN